MERSEVVTYLRGWLAHPETCEIEHPQTIKVVRAAADMLEAPEPPAAALEMSEISRSNCDAIAYHLEKGIDNGGITRDALAVFLRHIAAAAQGPTREELAEALRGCLNDDTGDWVDNAMDLLARHVASKGEPAEIGGEET